MKRFPKVRGPPGEGHVAVGKPAAGGAVLYVFLRDGCPIARPARAGVELCHRTEKRRIATDAPEQSSPVLVPEGAAEGPLGTPLPRDFEGEAAFELSAPGIIGLHHFGNGDGSLAHAVISELDDRYRARGPAVPGLSHQATAQDNQS